MYTSVDVLIGNDSGQTKIADFYREILMKIREKKMQNTLLLIRMLEGFRSLWMTCRWCI